MVLQVLFGVLVFVMALGIPIAWCLGIAGLSGLIAMGGVPLSIVPQKMFSGMDIFPMLCLPFFILAGEFMGHGSIGDRLLRFAMVCVGRVRGGLSLANVLNSMFFGGITGSATADASSVGAIEYKLMVKSGYDAPFSAAITAASSCMGPIIPPSLPVVIYAVAVSGVSIGGLFAAGLIPGIFIGLALMVTCYIISIRREYPKREEPVTFKEFVSVTWEASLALVLPVIIFGGIVFGVFTPTEAAAVAAVYSFIVSCFIYRDVKISELPGIFYRAGVISAVVMMIIATANIFGVVIAYERVALTLQSLVEPLGYYGFLFVVNIIFLIVGMFMDQNPAILILAPVFAPVAVNLGIHPLHFGMMLIVNLVIGLLTPPLGQILFVVCSYSGVKFEDMVREVFVFIMVDILCLMLIAYIPFFTTFVPALLGYIR
jgi:tripartite ATP-independent transporter DctM subunit